MGDDGLQIGGSVKKVDGRKLSYEEFAERYMKRNRPVVLTGLMDGWRACVDWLTADGLPNLPFFAQNFGHSIVHVADCCKKEFTDQKRVEMSVSEYIAYWLGLSAKHSMNDLNSNNTSSLLYLKDWHFVKEYPDYVAYTTPQFFLDDWLNLYLDSHFMHQGSDANGHQNDINCADYRFVYMGPKGTWTPLHADVFRSYSWSANVCGKKLWHFLPPSQCHLVFDRNLKNSVYDVHDDVSEAQFPGFKKAVWLECTQEKNEIIFVPSGWYHQVHNLEDTISINHNWFNAYNLPWVWYLLRKDYEEAKAYIEDIRDIADDFEGLCQRNLAANTGMNFYDFFTMITRFALVNSIQLYHLRNYEKNSISRSPSTEQRLLSNLLSIRSIARCVKYVDAFTKENLNSCAEVNLSANSCPREILVEPEFIRLSMDLIQAYGIVEEPLDHDYLIKMITSSVRDAGSSTFIHSSEFKICCPEDLVKLIDHAIADHSSNCNGCSFSLTSDASDVESLMMLGGIVLDEN